MLAGRKVQQTAHSDLFEAWGRVDVGARAAARPDPGSVDATTFWRWKRVFDLALAVALLPVLALMILLVVPVNRVRNPGPLFFRQRRMGRDCSAFALWKFRTMRPSGNSARGPEDPLEQDRITPFGRWLRLSRLDELPQIVNVLCGEMSFVGPRPDILEHALVFLEAVPGYQQRYRQRPGITGLAQVQLGYVEGAERTARKVALDLAYLRRASWRLERAILARTIVVMLSGFGAK